MRDEPVLAELRVELDYLRGQAVTIFAFSSSSGLRSTHRKAIRLQGSLGEMGGQYVLAPKSETRWAAKIGDTYRP